MTKTRNLADLGGGFIQAGTGAVQRTVESKLQDVVSVLDFIPESEHAAIKDGTSTYNATAAIQAALDTGRFIRFPAGTYNISSALSITQNNTGVVGEGSGTLIQTTSTTADVFTIGDGTNEISGLYFSNFIVWSAVVKSAGYVFNCRYVTDSKWDNVYAGALDLYVSSGFSHRLYDGYYFNRFNQNVIESGQIVVSNDGITARGNTDQSFGAELSVSGGLRIFGAAGKGIWLGGACGGIYLDRIDISECFRGVYLDDTLAGVTNREVFLDSGLTIDSCTGWGLNIEANSVALLESDGPWIASCGNSTTSEGGIRIAPSSGISARWSNLRVYNCYFDGIQLNSGTHNFSGGFIRNCGKGTPGGHGLLLVACDHLLLNGMTVHNNGNVTRGYGISIEGTVNNYTVQGNYLFGNGQGDVYQPSGPSLTQTVRNNLGYTTENNGFAVVPSGSSTVDVSHGLDGTPTFVEVGFAGPMDSTSVYVFAAPSSFTSTQFTITYSATAAVDRDFWWRATRGQA